MILPIVPVSLPTNWDFLSTDEAVDALIAAKIEPKSAWQGPDEWEGWSNLKGWRETDRFQRLLFEILSKGALHGYVYELDHRSLYRLPTAYWVEGWWSNRLERILQDDTRVPSALWGRPVLLRLSDVGRIVRSLGGMQLAPTPDTGKRSAHRPKKRSRVLRSFADRLRRNSVKEQRSDEARVIISAWHEPNAPALKSVTTWIGPFHDQTRWSKNKQLENGLEIALQIDAFLAD